MSTAIAFLSGKGGSGKTTLALSTADLLCRCGVQTLLVDCDLSTNGATYFYESQLTTLDEGQRPRSRSFDGLMKGIDIINEFFPLTISSGLDFIPSILDISNQYLGEEERIHRRDCKSQLEKFLTWARKNYEVILFDCQAGYAEFLPILLPLMDADLFVMEADSISASAMRSLHLKIGNSLGHARLYQVFNKATPDEYDTYSKIVGTFFTNIGTLLFDWKIRQAFSRSQVPDIENTSAKYGIDLCEICKVIFTDKVIQEKLGHFSTRLLCKQLTEEYEQVEEKLYKLADKPYEKILPTILGLIAYIGSIFSIIILITDQRAFFKELSDVKLLIPMVIALIPVIFILTLNLSRPPREEQRGYKRRLKEIERELEKLTHIE